MFVSKSQQAGQVTSEVAGEAGTKLALSRHQIEILDKCFKESTLQELMVVTGRSDRTKFRHHVLNPLIHAKLIEMTVPNKPRSSREKYGLTEKGHRFLSSIVRKIDEYTMVDKIQLKALRLNSSRVNP